MPFLQQFQMKQNRDTFRFRAEVNNQSEFLVTADLNHRRFILYSLVLFLNIRKYKWESVRSHTFNNTHSCN